MSDYIEFESIGDEEIVIPTLPTPKAGQLEAMREKDAARRKKRGRGGEAVTPNLKGAKLALEDLAKAKGVDLKKVVAKPKNEISIESILSDIEKDFKPFVIPSQKVSYEDAKKIFSKVMLWKIKQQGRKYIPCKKQGEIIEYLIKYFIDDPSSKIPLNSWVILVGDAGTGKTFLMDCIAYMCEKLKLRKRFKKVEAKHLDEYVKEDGYKVIKKHCSGTLFFNDVGMDDVNNKNYGNHINTFETIFFNRNEKYESTRQLTFATSNLSKEDFQNRYGKRIGSRLEGNSIFIDFTTERKIQDFRQS